MPHAEIDPLDPSPSLSTPLSGKIGKHNPGVNTYIDTIPIVDVTDFACSEYQRRFRQEVHL